MKGKVKNLAEYGAFIEFGCEREGLVHVSHCSETFIKHPSETLKEGQDVEVRVLGVDLATRKIRLSLLTEEQEKEREAQRKQRQGGRGDGGGQGGGGRGGQGGGGRGGQGGGRGGQGGGQGGRGGGKGRGRREEFGPDPKRQKKEEFDPTNPFYVFFQDKQEDGKGEKESKGSST